MRLFMLYLIGLGLWDEGDISLRAIEAIKACDHVYAEFYTNKWTGDMERLEHLTGKKIHVIKRLEVESEKLTEEARQKNVALLIPGDPLAATTHVQLMIDSKEKGVECKIVHSSSIYTSVAETGLQLYKFGRATTLAFMDDSFKPTSPYEVVMENRKLGLHTMVLLDIREHRLMTIAEGVEVLLGIGMDSESKIVACCQMGGPQQKIRYGKASQLIKDPDLTDTPSVIIIPGKIHFKEEEALRMYEY